MSLCDNLYLSWGSDAEERAHLTHWPLLGYITGSTAQACQDRKLLILYTFRRPFFFFLKQQVLQSSVHKQERNLSHYLSTLPRHSVCTSSNKKMQLNGFPLNSMKMSLLVPEALLAELPPHLRHCTKEQQLPALSEQIWNFQSSTSAQLLLPRGPSRATLVPSEELLCSECCT